MIQIYEWIELDNFAQMELSFKWNLWNYLASITQLNSGMTANNINYQDP